MNNTTTNEYGMMRPSNKKDYPIIGKRDGWRVRIIADPAMLAYIVDYYPEPDEVMDEEVASEYAEELCDDLGFKYFEDKDYEAKLISVWQARPVRQIKIDDITFVIPVPHICPFRRDNMMCKLMDMQNTPCHCYEHLEFCTRCPLKKKETQNSIDDYVKFVDQRID